MAVNAMLVFPNWFLTFYAKGIGFIRVIEDVRWVMLWFRLSLQHIIQ